MNASAGMGDRKTGRRCGALGRHNVFKRAWLKAGKIPELGSQDVFCDCFHRQGALTHDICTALASAPPRRFFVWPMLAR